MRENLRERNAAQSNNDNRRDFRDNLYSIFVDNLNPKVDYECLWGLFKPFGKVRDIYLSPDKSRRTSRFAFVRFGTQEEATKVAMTTNGMHVYSWPIVTKMADRGWKNRGVNQERQRPFVKENYRQQGGKFQRMEENTSRSFVEAVRGFQTTSDRKENGKKDTMMTMALGFWEE